MAYQTIDAWMIEVLSDSERKATSIGMLYEQPTGGTKEVFGQVLEGKSWEPEVLARVFRGKAEQFVQDKPGKHDFVLQAFFNKEMNAGSTRHFVVQDGEVRSGGSATRTIERPNAEGILGQHMRMLENMHVLVRGMSEALAVGWVTERREILAELRKERSEVSDAYAVIRELVMGMQKDQHEMEMGRLRYARESEERKLLLKTAGPLANAVFNKEVVPHAMVDSALIEQAAKYMTPDKVQLLVQTGAIPQEFAAPLLARFAQIAEEKKKEEAEVAKLPAGVTGSVTDLLTERAKRQAKGGGEDEGGLPALPAE